MKIIQSTLGDLCEVDWGNTNLTKSSYVTDGRFLAVSASGPDGRIDHFEHEGYIPVLSAIGAQCGKMFFPTEKFTAIKNTITLTPLKNIVDGKYLYYLFTHIDLPKRGAGQPFISKGDIQSFKIAIPKEVKDQKGIVEKLDKAFAEIDSLEKNLKLKEDKSNQLFQSMLSAAFTNTEEFDMQFVKLGDVATFEGGSQPAKSNFVYHEKKGFVRFIQIRDFKNEKNLTYIPESKKNRLCKESDILIGRYGASVGQILTGLSGAYNVALIKASPKESLILRKFFYYFLNSEFFQIPLLNISKRSAQSGFTKEEISSFLIPLPSLKEQQILINKLDLAFAEIEKLKNQILLEKERISTLRQSILSDAFHFEEKVA